MNEPTLPPLDPTSTTQAIPEVTNPVLTPSAPEKGIPMQKVNPRIALIVSLLTLAAGLSSGWFLFGILKPASQANNSPIAQVAGDKIQAGDIFGSADLSPFPDTVEGYLESGGIDGEGSHHLLRPGGKAQTVYLTSSVTDLEKLIGMQIKIWGETYKGQKAGWLVDVGRIEVLDPQASPPTESE